MKTLSGVRRAAGVALSEGEKAAIQRIYNRRPKVAYAAKEANSQPSEDEDWFRIRVKGAQPIRPTFADLAKLAEQLRPTDIVPPSAPINLRKKYTRRGHPPGSTEQTRNDQIMARLQTGTTTMQSVAIEFNITRERVRQIAKKYYGQTARSLRIVGRRDPEVLERERQKKERTEGRKHTRETKLKKMIELRDADMSQAEIAEIMGVSQGAISARLCRAGIRSMIKHGSPPDAVRTHKKLRNARQRKSK